ncbi:putative DNA helicase [Aspergillus vadensis CBS 113365]|uniref:DNA helicase n=1 Tax=Aspergillus vadensis (strain CBS 113365 / IMI 142717 / IBT 24658) TaxID=1448311 RepID=A0A319C6R8_ASPVC|nr:DNA helicase [Aspergillus vadensis CBS 113365]PYH64532.1 DNA helicase [Aspergillus vadensis CBS 113365]
MSPKISPPTFATTQLTLLRAEQTAEITSNNLFTSSAITTASPSTRRTLQATGHALMGIVLSQCRTGLGGRVVGEFVADAAVTNTSSSTNSGSGAKGGNGGGGGGDGKLRLGAHGVRVGDVVKVVEISSGSSSGSGGGGGKKGKEKEGKDGKGGGVEGVVTRVGESAVWVAFGGKDGGKGGGSKDEDGVEELWGRKVWMIKLANDVTYRRMNQTMEKMVKMTDSEHTHFMRVAFGQTSPMVPDYDSIGSLEFTDPTLNDSQKEAIRFALAAREIALIHGPPGTGKTHTLIELIVQMVQRKQRVLVCGPSNISVDNIVERLAPKKVPVVRIGHPARLLPSVLDHSLEVLTHTSEAAEIVRDVRKEIDQKQASIRKTRSARERRAIYDDLRELRREFRERENKCVENLVRESSVVLATLHGAGGHQLKNQKFDVVIIDEASQALEAQCWIPLLSASKVILAGDHLQLPPTVKSTKDDAKKMKAKEEDKKENGELLDNVSLETTLFDRLLSMHGPGIKRMLTTQYRMHEKIMQFPSDELYDSKLMAADSVKARLLKDLPYEVEETDDTKEPLVFWDTQGGDFPEKTEDADLGKKAHLGDSKSNDMEALVVSRHVDALVDAGIHPEDIAVITPYNGQLAVLSQMLREKYPSIELGSVDGFQGREKEAVVVSLVRSNSEHEVGFLGERRRLNVAMTRPKRHLCICGDSETISKGSGFLKRWMAFLEEHADLRYPDAGDLL